MLFSADFFERETRCGFEITEMMKRAWAVQMEVLSLVADICEKNGLQYFAEGGTLLGAVRHQGFIPWDDDIDIGLRREDYNELVRILPEKLPRGFKLGGIHAIPKSQDDVFPGFHSRVGTDSAVWGLKEHLNRFYGFPYAGIGIDIFAYDYLPRDKELKEVQVMILEYGKSLLGHWGEFQEEDGELERRLQEWEELCGADISREGNIRWNLQKRMDSVAGLFLKDESDEMSDILSTSILRRGRTIRVRKECLEKVMYMPFEAMEIAVPVGWHELLVATFGENYMTFDRGTAGHEYPFWVKEEKELRNMISGLGLQYNVEEFCERVLAGEINLQII